MITSYEYHNAYYYVCQHTIYETICIELGGHMELYIFDTDKAMLGVIEAYEYLRWTRRYSKCGGFELKAVATSDNIALLQIGRILWKNDDEEAGVIEYVELTMQERESITVSGRFATSLLARRAPARFPPRWPRGASRCHGAALPAASTTA